MFLHLSELLNSFPGAANQTWCFAHTLSISAKAILKQFDVPKGETLDKDLDMAAWAFADLTKELDFEEQLAQESQEVGDDDDEDQPLDSWVNFCDGLMEEELEDLDASIQPMRLMLSKVHWLIFHRPLTLCWLICHTKKVVEDDLPSQKFNNYPPPAVVQNTDCT